MKDPDELLTVAAAAAERGVQPAAIYRAIKLGYLKAEKVQGGALILRRRELDAYQPRRGGKRPGQGRPRRPTIRNESA